MGCALPPTELKARVSATIRQVLTGDPSVTVCMMFRGTTVVQIKLFQAKACRIRDDAESGRRSGVKNGMSPIGASHTHGSGFGGQS
jgi:hypothetical protein